MTGALLRAAAAVEGWFFRPHPAAPAALIRILLGLVMLSAYLLYFPYMESWYGPEGFAHYVQRSGRSSLVETWLWPLYGALVASAACFALGLLTWISGIILVLTQILFINDFRHHTWGWAWTIPLLIAYLTLAGAGRAWSADAWLLRRWRAWRGLPDPAGPVTVAGWPMRLFQINLACVYLMAAWHRVNDVSWIRGDIVWEALTSTFFSRFPNYDWQPFKPVLRLMAWSSWVLEGLGVILLWVPRLGPWWAVGCILMHVGLEISASVGWWQFTLAASLLVFVKPQWCEALLRLPGRLLRRLSGSRSGAK